MIISDLNYLEVASEAKNVEGGTGVPSRNLSFNTTNSFTTSVTTPTLGAGNSASYGGYAEVVVGAGVTANSYTKTDGQALATVGGGSVSQSVGVAVGVRVH